MKRGPGCCAVDIYCTAALTSLSDSVSYIKFYIFGMAHSLYLTIVFPSYFLFRKNAKGSSSTRGRFYHRLVTMLAGIFQCERQHLWNSDSDTESCIMLIDTYSMKQPDLYCFETIKMTSQA